MRTLRFLAFMASLCASFLASRSAGQTRFSTLYTFSDFTSSPQGVVAGPNGALYGVTPGPLGGYGSVYELQPPPESAAPTEKWTETVLYSFTGQNGDGADPNSLVLGANGIVYGTTTVGGTYGYGTVFELQPPASGGTWTETVLYSFTGFYGYSNVIAGNSGRCVDLQSDIRLHG
jgi:hypothetical protein